MANKRVRKQAPKAAQQPTRVTIPIRKTAIVVPPSIMPVFSDGMIIQAASESFILSFIKIMHPLTDDGKPDDIESRCVAQVVITPSQMADNLKVMVNHFRGFASAQTDEVKSFLLKKAGMEE